MGRKYIFNKEKFFDSLIKFNYTLISDINDASLEVTVKCNEHNEIHHITPGVFTKNKCSCCIKNNGKHGSLEERKIKFIEKSNQIHNFKYDYSKVDYKGTSHKVIIICPLHGEFSQPPDSHLRGYKCKKCKLSYGEKIIMEKLEKIGIKFIYNKGLPFLINPETNKPLRPDFYLPEYHLCIEFQGGQHFNLVGKFGGEKEFLKTQKLDKLKKDLCVKNQIELWEITWDSIFNIDEQFIKLKNRPIIEEDKIFNLLQSEAFKEYRNSLINIKFKDRVNPRKGRPISESHKSNISKGLKNRKVTWETGPKGVKILQYDLEGNFIKEWDSILCASKILKIDSGGLSNAINKIQKTAGGFIWERRLE